MKLTQQWAHLLAAALLFAGLSFNVGAQDQNKQAQPASDETSITGCLTKSDAESYTLTDEKSGAKTKVTGPAALEKHSTNHKVTLTGSAKKDNDGNPVFEVTKIKHISPTCGGSQPN